MMLRPSADNVRIVGWRHVGYRARRPSIQVAQGEGEVLEVVRGEIVLIDEARVVRRATGAKKPAVALQEEVKLHWVRYVPIDDQPSGGVTAPIGVFCVRREEPVMMALANHDHRKCWSRLDTRLVACGSDPLYLDVDDLRKLTFRYTISVEDDATRVQNLSSRPLFDMLGIS